MSQTGEMTIRGGNSGGNRSGVAEALRRAGRRAGVAAAALGVLLAGSGCGGNGDANAAADPTAGSAATATQEATGKCSPEASATEILNCLGYKPHTGMSDYQFFQKSGYNPDTEEMVSGTCPDSDRGSGSSANASLMIGVSGGEIGPTGEVKLLGDDGKVTELFVQFIDGKYRSITDTKIIKKLFVSGDLACGESAAKK